MARLPRYFDVTASFQLFRLSDLQMKLRQIQTTTQRTALLAAILAFGLKGLDHNDANNLLRANVFSEVTGTPSIYFRGLAIRYMDQAITELDDERFSLPLLQTMILNTHCLLVQKVRGKAWRYLGTCIRAAYELNLHLIDANQRSRPQLPEPEVWCAEEEWRRAWWAIWEMDVYASVIRRCPAGIDWTQNDTMLPADDERWHLGVPQSSCFLEVNVMERWKSLATVKSRSPRAWFIVINSLMKDAQKISSPTNIDKSFISGPASGLSGFEEQQYNSRLKFDEAAKRLSTVLNALFCTVVALPEELRYCGQNLDFGGIGIELKCARDKERRLSHTFTYGIYAMTQLTKMMVLKYYVFRSGMRWFCNRDERSIDKTMAEHSDSLGLSLDSTSTTATADARYLAQYFEAADNVVTVIRACSEDHYKHSNAFMASTVWLAGAVQLLHRSRLLANSAEMDLATSNFELLRLTYEKTIDFWNMSTVPVKNWDALQRGLDVKLTSSAKRLEYHALSTLGAAAGDSTQARSKRVCRREETNPSKDATGFIGQGSDVEWSPQRPESSFLSTSDNMYDEVGQPPTSTISEDVEQQPTLPFSQAFQLENMMPLSMPFTIDQGLDVDADFSNSLDEMFSASYLQ
jgi:hypothetical protein